MVSATVNEATTFAQRGDGPRDDGSPWDALEALVP